MLIGLAYIIIWNINCPHFDYSEKNPSTLNEILLMQSYEICKQWNNLHIKILEEP